VIATAVAPTYSEGDMVAASCDLNGNLRTTATLDGEGLEVTVADAATATKQDAQTVHLAAIETATEAIQTAAAAIETATEAIQTAVEGTLAVSGTFWQATQPVSLASVPSHAVTNAGTFATQAAQSGTWTVQPGNTANTTPWLTTPRPATSGGHDVFRSIDLDETEEQVKATAGQVYRIIFTNTATATRWLKFYNATAANVTVGTTTPVLTIGLPGNADDDISGVLDVGGDVGVPFSTAITVAATTGVADNDTGAPGANEVIVNIAKVIIKGLSDDDDVHELE